MGCSKLSSLGGLVQGTGGYELGTDMQQYARRGNSPVAEEVTGKQITPCCADPAPVVELEASFLPFRPALCNSARFQLS